MKRSLALVLVLLLLAAASPRLCAKGAEVLVAADAIVTPEGFRPAPGKPIYYIFSQTPQSLGESIAGIKLPEPALIEQCVVAELAKQGFIRTQVGGPMPSTLIVATYGPANFKPTPDEDDLAFYRAMVMTRPGMTDAEITAEAQRLKYISSPRFRDRAGVEAITGVAKVFSSGPPPIGDNHKLLSAANDDRLYISLGAFDAALFAKKEKRLLWRTSMSIDWRNDFAATLPVMLASGGPLFGTDVKTPRFLDDRERRNFEVKIGEATEVFESLPKSDPSPNRKK